MSTLTVRYCSIQTLILPVFEEEFDVFSAKAKECAYLLEFAPPGRFLKPASYMTGRPACNRSRILNALHEGATAEFFGASGYLPSLGMERIKKVSFRFPARSA